MIPYRITQQNIYVIWEKSQWISGFCKVQFAYTLNSLVYMENNFTFWEQIISIDQFSTKYKMPYINQVYGNTTERFK